MPRVVKRSASQAITSGPSRRGVPLPQFVLPQLSQPVEKPPSGPQWLHEIKLDGYRMAARIDNGRVQLLTRTGLDWTSKYPSVIAALSNMNVKTAYVDGALEANRANAVAARLAADPALARRVAGFKADMAMRQAKDQGRNSYAFFGQSMAVRSLGRLSSPRHSMIPSCSPRSAAGQMSARPSAKIR